MSKLSTKKNNLYLPILNTFRETTNLTKIRQKFNISKQNLNNYLRDLKTNGYLIKKGRGYYEVNRSKDLTKYGKLLSKDFTRGHAYIWTIKLPQEIEESGDWKNRVEILKSKGVHFNLVGAKGTTPRIKVLGRKVWLCNDHLRIFDKKGISYYGQDAKHVRHYVINEVSLIVGVLEKRLGVSIRSLDLEFNREHYALIKNDLAIEHNKKGETLHIKDKFGEWLLIDDSLGEGGELENVGKSAYRTNIPMQKWWNNQKETGFKVTPEFILESISKVTQNQEMFASNIEKHIAVLQGIEDAIKELKENLKK